MATIQSLDTGELASKVLQARGPVVLDFYQATCPPCRALEPVLERVARDFAGRVAVYRVDIDRDPTVAERFGIDSLPTVLMVRDGREADRLDGLVTESQLRDTFGRAETGTGEGGG